MIAAGAKRKEHVAALLQAGADLNKADVNGFTPVWRAAKEKDHDMVILLVSLGARGPNV